MPAWKRAILSKQRERSRSQLQRKATHYYDRDGRKVPIRSRDDDDDYDNRRRGRRGEEDRRGRRKRSEEEGRRQGRGRRDDNRGKKDKSKGKRRGPTNVDDFDEDDYSDSESGSDSDSSEESGQKGKMTSEEAMKMLGTKWALAGDGDDIEDLDERIRTQQLEIQRELSGLTQLQRSRGMKALPSLQQKVLQSDLQKLQAIQSKLKENPGVRELQMLLVGQQMILCDHVKEIQSSLGQRQSPLHVTLDIPDDVKPIMSPATSVSQLPPPVAHQLPPPPAATAVFQPSYNPMQLAADQMLQNELIMVAEQQRRQQQLQLMAQQQRRQQQLLAAAQLSAVGGFGGLGMTAYSPLTPSVPLI